MVIKAPIYKNHNTILYYCPVCNGILGVIVPCDHYVSLDSVDTVVLLNVPPDVPREFEVRNYHDINLVAVSDRDGYNRTKVTKFFTQKHDFKELSFRNIILDILLKEEIVLQDEIETELSKWFTRKTYDIITKHIDRPFVINSMHNAIENAYKCSYKNVIISDIDILPDYKQVEFVKTYDGIILSINKSTTVDSMYVVELPQKPLDLFLENVVLRFTQPYSGRTQGSSY